MDIVREDETICSMAKRLSWYRWNQRLSYRDALKRVYGIWQRAVKETATTASAPESLEGNGLRWVLEEVFITLTQHRDLDDRPPSWLEVALATIRFVLLVFTLLGFHLQETEDADLFETLNIGPPFRPCQNRSCPSMLARI